MGRLFGTDGVRVDLNKSLDPAFFSSLSSSICESFGENALFLIGRDIRFGGDIILHAVLSGLLSSGCRAYYAGLVTTPALQYNVKMDGGFDGGIMITASHNPPNYNGIKVIDSDGIEIPRSKEEEIEQLFFSSKVKRFKSSSIEFDVPKYYGAIERYVDAVVSQVDDELTRSRGLTVLLDAANSVGSIALPQIIRRLGGKVISLNGHLDPSFPGREPEPTPETLKLTSKIIGHAGADFGIAVDGDADRSIFIDELGTVQWGDRTATVLAPFIKQKHPELPPRVYTGISSSSFMEEILKQKGISVIWMKVGSVDISRRLKAEGGLMGFEENGGIMYPPHHYVRDAGMAVALMMELLSMERAKASELYSVYPRTYSIKTKYPLESREKGLEIYEKVKAKFSGARIIDIDGVKVMLEDAWFLIRMSGTEPVIRVMIESKKEGQEKDILMEVERLLQVG
ncbi:MAG: phosphoglucosamine mutase [Thermoprotei archaeon]|nr:phosphoglucosamine mutase [Thermoprotei archaeon]